MKERISARMLRGARVLCAYLALRWVELAFSLDPHLTCEYTLEEKKREREIEREIEIEIEIEIER